MLAFGLGIVVIAIFMISVLSGIDEFSTLSKDDQVQSGIFDFGLIGARFLVIIAAVIMLGFGLFQMLSNFKASLKGLIGFAVLIIVFIVAYKMASGEANEFIQYSIDKFESNGAKMSAANLKFISGGITTALVLLVVAGLAFVLSEIRNFFK